MKIAVITPPFSGHFNILSKLVSRLRILHKEIEITFIVTGWHDVKTRTTEIDALKSYSVNVHELSSSKINTAAPMSFTFKRVADLTDEVIHLCEGHDLIINDFFSIEGYIASKALNIANICSIPAILGPFNHENNLYKKNIKENNELISQLEKKYNINLIDNIEMVSDGFFIPSKDGNLIWSWPKLVKADNYLHNRKIQNILFSRVHDNALKSSKKNMEKDLASIINIASSEQKIIYVSLGTVVTDNLWNNMPCVKDFVLKIYSDLAKSFGGNSKYRVIISTSKQSLEAFSERPSNFYFFNNVPQPEILKRADVFVTHGGGNSVNEAIDAQIPMVVIPFFGDQHLCAKNVDHLKIGIAFQHTKQDREDVVNTEHGLFFRDSLKNDSELAKAIETVLSDSIYRNNIKLIKNENITSVNELFNKIINKITVDWHEGDLLYGCNQDRKKFAEILGEVDSFKLCDIRPFPKLFANSLFSAQILPRIVDQYHDELSNNQWKPKDEERNKFTTYYEVLDEYRSIVKNELLQLENITDQKEYEKKLWEMCLKGLEFFIYKKKATIHFVISSYNDQVNLATNKEFQWVKQHWNDNEVKKHVKFYYIQKGLLKNIDPVQSNWFRSRPTPAFEDIAPSLVAKNSWQAILNKIQTRQSLSEYKNITVFHNNLKEKYDKEFQDFKKSGLDIVDVRLDAEKAKISLSNKEVHIFAIHENGNMFIIPKRSGEIIMSHAIVGKNEPVICAGEVRLRNLNIKGKVIQVLDINNESGHYMPNGGGLKFAIKAFEKIGFIVHRVNVINTKVTSSFNKVEDNSSLKPICRSKFFEDYSSNINQKILMNEGIRSTQGTYSKAIEISTQLR